VEGLLLKLKLFWIFWGIDALICVIALVYFFLGLANGSVASFNIGIWMAGLAALTVIIVGSLLLKKHGHPIFGIVLLLVLAIPALLYGLFVFLFVVTGTTWN
jgi:hypothetical protein